MMCSSGLTSQYQFMAKENTRDMCVKLCRSSRLAYDRYRKTNFCFEEVATTLLAVSIVKVKLLLIVRLLFRNRRAFLRSNKRHPHLTRVWNPNMSAWYSLHRVNPISSITWMSSCFASYEKEEDAFSSWYPVLEQAKQDTTSLWAADNPCLKCSIILFL